METPLYGNPLQQETLSDGSVITFRRPTRKARDEAYETAMARLAEMAKQANWTPQDAEDGAEEPPDNRTDEQKMIDGGKLFDRMIILSDALEAWDHDGECVFGDVEELTPAVLSGAPDTMLEEARAAVWQAHVAFEFRHRKN